MNKQKTTQSDVSFLYYKSGDGEMSIYVDLVLFLNITMDFLLLLAVSVILKRNVKIYRIFLGALTGGISLIFLFISINNLTLFLFKIIISILMVWRTYNLCCSSHPDK